MKIFALRPLLMILITPAFLYVRADVRLPAVLGSHMVLQQKVMKKYGDGATRVKE